METTYCGLLFVLAIGSTTFAEVEQLPVACPSKRSVYVGGKLRIHCVYNRSVGVNKRTWHRENKFVIQKTSSGTRLGSFGDNYQMTDSFDLIIFNARYNNSGNYTLFVIPESVYSIGVSGTEIIVTDLPLPTYPRLPTTNANGTSEQRDSNLWWILILSAVFVGIMLIPSYKGIQIWRKKRGSKPDEETSTEVPLVNILLKKIDKHVLKAYQEKRSMVEIPELRVLIFGLTGVGKSETGNTLTKSTYFETAPMTSSVTKKCTRGTLTCGKRLVHFLDTPGFVDQGEQNCTDNYNELRRFPEFFGKSGIHIFLFVHNLTLIDDAPEILNRAQKVFGDGWLDHAVAIFTHSDDAEETIHKRDLDKILASQEAAETPFIQVCNLFQHRIMKVENIPKIANASHIKEYKDTISYCFVHLIDTVVQANNGTEYFIQSSQQQPSKNANDGTEKGMLDGNKIRNSCCGSLPLSICGELEKQLENNGALCHTA